MSPTYHAVIANLGFALLVGAATGLVVRGRASFCWTFVVYLLSTASFQSLIIWWPERFFVFTFYFVKELVLVLLKIGVAFEIWQRCFSSFPQARVRTGFLLTSALAVMALASQLVPDGLYPYDLLMGVILPRLQSGVLLLYALLVCATAWYRVPMHPTHRAILLGFA
ncbi:MAG TPA: hypothetical protein VFQ51_07820, partial [Vicinamibacteria bacterium]|nr:hypothetical protein [Vicinamibacteria bacterium]